MDKIMEKLNKLSLPATILIASIILGGFYYASQVNKQKSIERQQQIEIEQKRQEQLDKELKEKQAKEEAKQELNTCIAYAEQRYSDQWFIECKSRGLLTNKCISLKEMTFDEYAEQNNIPQDKRIEAIFDFYKQRNECSCRLPISIADSINKYRDKLKDECFKKYPQQ
jgi:hypothetical protein